MNANLFDTDDIALAAWLVSRGHKVANMDRDGRKVFWQFRQTDELNDDAYVFAEGEPMVNARAYNELLYMLKRSIYRPEAARMLSDGAVTEG